MIVVDVVADIWFLNGDDAGATASFVARHLRPGQQGHLE